MNNRELKRLANKASNGMANYNGGKKVSLNVVDYAGNGSDQRTIKDRKVETTITNPSDGDVTIALFVPDCLKQLVVGGKMMLNGQDIWVPNTTGEINIGTEVEPVNVGLSEFRDLPYSVNSCYLADKVAAIAEWRIRATSLAKGSVGNPSTDQLPFPITQKILNPTVDKIYQKTITPEEYFSQDQFQKGIVNILDGFTVDDASLVTYTIAAETKVSITMYISALLNFGKALEKFTVETGLAFQGVHRPGVKGLNLRRG